MWIDKLARGVLALDTPIGPRYLQPGFLERALLLWTFRNFDSLPQLVLHAGERRLIDRLANENRFVSLSSLGEYERPIIGTVEWRKPQSAGLRDEAPDEVLPMRKPVSASTGIVEQGREAASAWSQGSRVGMIARRAVSA
jgi:hypothetical protein